MRLLIVKTSSLGDVIHTLPALTDALHYYPDLQCDWVVEEAFAEIPSWHPAVKRVIPVALRRWRKNLWKTWQNGAWKAFKHALTQYSYDKIVDAQGLIKSAFLTYQAQGIRCGFDKHAAREPLAALAYQQRYPIPKGQHAVTRVRQLLAAALNYAVPDSSPNYGITEFIRNKSDFNILSKKTILFLHGTTWVTKHYPLNLWLELARRLTTMGYAIRLPWGNAIEYERAQRIATVHPHISLIPKSNLYGIALELMQAKAVIGVDTGLAHLAAALAVPSITVYGATQPAWTGTYGQQQVHLQAQFPCAPCLQKRCTYRGESSVFPACYETLSVEKILQTFNELC